MVYQPKTGARCFCKRGVQRDNCPTCEGTGWQVDFVAIRQRQVEFTKAAGPDMTEAQRNWLNTNKE